MGRDELHRDLGITVFALPIDKVEVLVALWELGEDPHMLMEDIHRQGIDSALDTAAKRWGYRHGDSYLYRYSALLFASMGF